MRNACGIALPLVLSISTAVHGQRAGEGGAE